MHSSTPAGGMAVASTVTRAGPMTNVISSTTDSRANAECSASGSGSSALHRARTMEPSDGIDDPARQPVISRTQTGALSSAQATKMRQAAPKTAISGRSTRCCPNRSASLAICGAEIAYPTAPAPDTRPASAYRPVEAATSSTVPRPNIDIGARPIIPLTQKRAAPGVRSSAR